MEKAVRAYAEVLRLVRLLPKDSRAYYAKYARENFVNYRDVVDPSDFDDLFQRTYTHSLWVLHKVRYLTSLASSIDLFPNNITLLCFINCSIPLINLLRISSKGYAALDAISVATQVFVLISHSFTPFLACLRCIYLLQN